MVHLVFQNRNITGNLHGFEFLALLPKTQATKEKFGKLDFVNIKNSCISKDIIKKVKRQSKEWKKVFTNNLIRVNV